MSAWATRCLRHRSLRSVPIPKPAADGGSTGWPLLRPVSWWCPSAGSPTTGRVRETRPGSAQQRRRSSPRRRAKPTPPRSVTLPVRMRLPPRSPRAPRNPVPSCPWAVPLAECRSRGGGPHSRWMHEPHSAWRPPRNRRPGRLSPHRLPPRRLTPRRLSSRHQSPLRLSPLRLSPLRLSPLRLSPSLPAAKLRKRWALPLTMRAARQAVLQKRRAIRFPN